MRRAVGESISDAWKPKQQDEVRGYPILQRTIAAVPPTETTRLPGCQSGGFSTCAPTVSIATLRRRLSAGATSVTSQAPQTARSRKPALPAEARGRSQSAGRSGQSCESVPPSPSAADRPSTSLSPSRCGALIRCCWSRALPPAVCHGCACGCR
jgi:hypothetical protein